MVECQSCGAQYEQVGTDGVPYFHVCGPVTVLSVRRNGDPALVQLSLVQPDDVITVLRDSALVDVRFDATEAGDVRQGDQQIPRPNGRDETPTPAIVDDQRVMVPKSEGAGVETVLVEEAAAPVMVLER